MFDGLKDKMPLYLSGQPVFTNNTLKVYNKYTQDLISEVSMADSNIVEQALGDITKAKEKMMNLSSYERKAILQQCMQQIKDNSLAFAEIICEESGKPIRDAKTEVERAISTFEIASEEANRIYGEVLPLDVSLRGKNFAGMWKRVPIGPCLFITPFNFPLNLVAHKVAPAIAVGCPFILKPASKTPLSSLLLGEILSKTDLPKNAFSILPCENDEAEHMVQDDRLKLLSFTGSAKVGWELKSKSGKKANVLELGGNAACVLDNNINIDFAVERLIFGAFYQSGQSCISVQRIFIHENIYNVVAEKMIDKIKKFKTGNPMLEETFIGPMISEKDAKRIEEWVLEAEKKGAKILCGGKRESSIFEATLLENVDHDQTIYKEEAFAPVAILEKYSDFTEVLKEVNNTRYGLQAGVFTNDLKKVYQAWDTIEVGGLMINEVPAFRADSMPYGGVKDSGMGREGVRFAIEHLTEMRMLAINLK